jgi:hypothetical protein
MKQKKKSELLLNEMREVCGCAGIPVRDYEPDFYNTIFRLFPDKKWPLQLIRVAWLFYNKGIKHGMSKRNESDNLLILKAEKIKRIIDEN